MNFIEELYYGNIKPNARNSVMSARYEQATEITLKMQEKLKEALAEPERTMLERLIEADDEIVEETGMTDFKLKSQIQELCKPPNRSIIKIQSLEV